MKGKYIGIIAFLLVIVFLIASCSLIPPDLVLRVVSPSIGRIGVSNDFRITFKLKNIGSEALQNCKVKCYVDHIDNDPSDNVIELDDELTVWAPGTGVDLAVGETSAQFTVDTTRGIFTNGVNFYGIYAMGWDGPTD